MFKHDEVFASFSIDDPLAARQFYEKTLGLSVSDVPGMKELVEIKSPQGGTIIAYAKGGDHKPASFTVMNIVVHGIENVMADLRQKGVKFEVYDNPGFKTDHNGLSRHGDMAVAWFKDPAGNVLSILENPSTHKAA